MKIAASIYDQTSNFANKLTKQNSEEPYPKKLEKTLSSTASRSDEYALERIDMFSGVVFFSLWLNEFGNSSGFEVILS